MKNRFSKILSVLCVLAMLLSLLPGAFSESEEAAVQDTPEFSETVLSDWTDFSDTTAGNAENPAEVTAAEESAAEESVIPESVAEETVPEEPAAETAAAEPAAEESAAEEPVTEEPAAEEPAAEEPADAEPAEEESAAEESAEAETETEEPAAEEPVSAEETGKEEPAEDEPAVLTVGSSLTDTVLAGREYRILLKGSDADTVLLTLILEKGRTLEVRVDGSAAEFTEFETDDSVWAVFTYECQGVAWYDCPVSLISDTDTGFQLLAEAIPGTAYEKNVTEEPDDQEPGEEEPEDGESAAEGTPDEMPEGEEPAAEEPAEEKDETQEPAEEQIRITESDQAKLDAGYFRAIVIRQSGTNLYAFRDEGMEAAGRLGCGDVIWAKSAGDIWGEIRPDENSEPLYFNLNNVALQLGEIGYEVPARKVTLSSTMEGLTEIAEGTWIVITAEISGFTEDEIADITWQYRPAGDEAFFDIEDAHDISYIYSVSPENIHYEWRIVLTLKS